jgi:3,4-dihydroxyphenylacetate 2,3-dioxygenase
MTGGVIASAVASHTPRMAFEEKTPEFQRGLVAGSKEMGTALRAMQPDLFVVNSAHWISSFNWYATCQDPHEGICVAEEAPDLIPGIPYRRKGDPEFASAFVDTLQREGIPCFRNESPHYEWDYAALVPLLYLDPHATVPVVEISTCLSADHEECLRVGRLIHKIGKELGRRIVFIASCALSHKIVRGPHLWPTPERIQMDHRFMDLIQQGHVSELLAWFPQYSRDAVAEMGGRVLATMLGTLEALVQEGIKLAGRKYGDYAPSSGSGNVNMAVYPI